MMLMVQGLFDHMNRERSDVMVGISHYAHNQTDFAAYVRNPQASNPNAQMVGNPGYDDATIHALIAYFKTFSSPEQSQEKP